LQLIFERVQNKIFCHFLSFDF